MTFYIRLISLLLAFLQCSLTQNVSAAEGSQRRPNVLLIVVDDLAPIGTSFGGPVTLPAMAALAEQGVSFQANFANIPVCGASRASMMSGLAPSANRFLTFDSRLDQDAPEVPSLPAFFRAAGWHTVANGKLFDVIEDSAASWSEPVWSPEPKWHGKEPDGRGEHLQAAYIEPFSSARFPYSERLEVTDDAYPDGQVAAKSVNDLQRLTQRDAPFFLAVGFRKPHLPFNAPNRYWLDPENLEHLPPTWTQPSTSVLLDFASHRSPELRSQYDALPLFSEPDDQQAAEIIAAYHAATRYADAQVGRVLTTLAASAAADNTIVVLMGDHGFLLGQYKMWTKHALFEPALHTPLIIADPRLVQTEPRRSVTAVTDLLDIYPTLADLAGLAAPGHLDGVSLKPLLASATQTETPQKSASIARWQNGESIRNSKYRYTRWFNEDNETLQEMLFDMAADPAETINLIDRTPLSAEVQELVKLLAAGREGPVWSEALATNVSQWQLVTSSVGGLLIAALAYPLPALLIALLLLMVVVGVIWRLVRR